ncbi:MAG: regulator of sigma E protease [Candidatus Saccharimonadales bacterium]|jgi:regulator of sigma E protease
MIVVVGFLLIILLVIAHEAGHFWAARRSGVEVEEFGIGFPPRAKTLTKKNGTEYTLNWLPLGGFVKLKGENDSDTTKGSFGAARLRDKVKIMVAGVVMNLLVAYILFTVIALIGMPKLVEDQFTIASDTTVTRQEVLTGFIADDSPADLSGLELNDRIVSITETGDCIECKQFTLDNSEQLGDATKSLAGSNVDVQITRDGSPMTLQASLLSQETVDQSANEGVHKGYLGVVSDDFVVRRSTWSAPIVGAGVTLQFTQLTLEGLGSIFTGLFQGDTEAATQQVSGVVGVGYIFSSSSFLGSTFTLMIVAVISLSLAVMNILPIPALDGGRLFVTLFYRLIRRPLSKKEEERIHGTGFVLLMVLFVLITILDVNRFIL